MDPSARVLQKLLTWKDPLAAAPAVALTQPPTTFPTPDAYIASIGALWEEETKEGFRRSVPDALSTSSPHYLCGSLPAEESAFGSPLARVTLYSIECRGSPPSERSFVLLVVPAAHKPAVLPSPPQSILAFVVGVSLDRSGGGTFVVLLLKSLWDSITAGHPAAARVGNASASAVSAAPHHQPINKKPLGAAAAATIAKPNATHSKGNSTSQSSATAKPGVGPHVSSLLAMAVGAGDVQRKGDKPAASAAASTTPTAPVSKRALLPGGGPGTISANRGEPPSKRAKSDSANGTTTTSSAAIAASSATVERTAAARTAPSAAAPTPMTWRVWCLGNAVSALREGEALYNLRALYPALLDIILHPSPVSAHSPGIGGAALVTATQEWGKNHLNGGILSRIPPAVRARFHPPADFLRLFLHANFNKSQQIAIAAAVRSNDMLLIQGPPGTVSVVSVLFVLSLL